MDVTPPEGVTPVEITGYSGFGPSAEMIDLCRWAAWRWAGRLATFLRMASPERNVMGLRVPRPWPVTPDLAPLPTPRAVFRLPPTAAALDLIRRGAAAGPVLVVAPSVLAAVELSREMQRDGLPTVLHPDGWAAGAAGGVAVVGSRSAAFAPVAGLAGIVVVDEHDEALQAEGSPTWHAREVCLERARRAKVPVALCSPVPTLEALARSPLVTVDRAAERAGWATLQIIDRRDEDRGRSGLYSPRLVHVLRATGRVLCVLNTLGRAALLACAQCGTVTRCEHCDGPLSQDQTGAAIQPELSCRRCGQHRPVVCQQCGATKLKLLRQGVSRAREELAAVLGEAVGEVTARQDTVPSERVLVGTEAVLHRVQHASTVAFLEFDQELFADRYRASEQALALLARASRVVGGRTGTVAVQTRSPEHPVLMAALGADPSVISALDLERRAEHDLPPAVLNVEVGGEGAAAFLANLAPMPGVERFDHGAGTTLVGHDRRQLLDALAGLPRPSARLRLRVDPLRP